MGSKVLNKQLVAPKAKSNNSSLAVLNAAMKQVDEGFAMMAGLLSKDINPGALAAAYKLIDADWKKVIEAHREAARQALFAVVDAGHEELDYNGRTYTLKTSEPHAKKPDLAVLCAKSGLGVGDLGVPVITYEPDDTKIAKAVADGRLTTEDIDAARKSLGRRLSVEVK